MTFDKKDDLPAPPTHSPGGYDVAYENNRDKLNQCYKRAEDENLPFVQRKAAVTQANTIVEKFSNELLEKCKQGKTTFEEIKQQLNEWMNNPNTSDLTRGALEKINIQIRVHALGPSIESPSANPIEKQWEEQWEEQCAEIDQIEVVDDNKDYEAEIDEVVEIDEDDSITEGLREMNNAIYDELTTDNPPPQKTNTQKSEGPFEAAGTRLNNHKNSFTEFWNKCKEEFKRFPKDLHESIKHRVETINKTEAQLKELKKDVEEYKNGAKALQKEKNDLKKEAENLKQKMKGATTEGEKKDLTKKIEENAEKQKKCDDKKSTWKEIKHAFNELKIGVLSVCLNLCKADKKISEMVLDKHNQLKEENTKQSTPRPK